MAKAGWDVTAAALFAMLTASLFPMAANQLVVGCDEPNTTMPRVRTADPDIARAIAQATERSPTFRRLLDDIGRTDGIVWVSRGRCGLGASTCLLTYLRVAGPHRLLHVHVAPRRSGHELMESLGHEFQHVLEVLGSSARSTAEMYNFFEYGPGVYRIGDRFETRDAVEAGFAVGREVTRARRSRQRDPQAGQR